MPMDEVKIESHAELGSIDGEDVQEVTERYGTVADQRDMYRMGKTQKLRVSFSTVLLGIVTNNRPLSEKFWVLQHLRVQYDLVKHLGDTIGVHLTEIYWRDLY
jgi:hypothetical protein